MFLYKLRLALVVSLTVVGLGVAFEGGFELRSKGKLDDEAVALTVGPRRK